MAKKKVLLMGKANSGKTSMRSIIFANYLARDTASLGPTLDVEHSSVRFLGDLVLNLWDCGGQDAFYESYFERDRETIFRSVELLIYVFDIESEDYDKDYNHFCGVLEAMEENSPDARIFCLVHKMDLVEPQHRDEVLQDRKCLVEESCTSCGVTDFCVFGTSIWDETLYRAWSEIVTHLIPNINILEQQLEKFCRICDAEEVVLFERATFLVISHAQQQETEEEKEPGNPHQLSRTRHFDAHRFEKISNIVKQFKLSCGKAQSQFQGMQVSNARFSAFIDAFTSTTYIMVISSDPNVHTAATLLNIQNARPHFDRFIPRM